MTKTLRTNMQHCQEHDVYYNATFWQCNLCYQQQKDMVARLEESLKAWKDAWFAQRAATGRMTWTVPNPFVLRASDSKFFQGEYLRFLNFVERLNKERNPEPPNQSLNLIVKHGSDYFFGDFEPDPFPPIRKEALSGHWTFYQ